MGKTDFLIHTLVVFVIGILFLVTLISYASLGGDINLVYLLSLGIIFLGYLIFLVKKAREEREYSNKKLKEIDKIKQEMTGLKIASEKIESIKKNEEVFYIGSNNNKKYHLSTCRFSKSIKPEYKEENSDISYFKKRKYKPCKTCKPNKN